MSKRKVIASYSGTALGLRGYLAAKMQQYWEDKLNELLYERD